MNNHPLINFKLPYKAIFTSDAAQPTYFFYN